MWMPIWLSNDHVLPGGLQCLSLVWGMSHLGDDSQGMLRIIWVVSLIMILLVDLGHPGT